MRRFGFALIAIQNAQMVPRIYGTCKLLALLTYLPDKLKNLVDPQCYCEMIILLTGKIMY